MHHILPMKIWEKWTFLKENQGIDFKLCTRHPVTSIRTSSIIRSTHHQGFKNIDVLCSFKIDIEKKLKHGFMKDPISIQGRSMKHETCEQILIDIIVLNDL